VRSTVLWEFLESICFFSARNGDQKGEHANMQGMHAMACLDSIVQVLFLNNDCNL